jgi:pilus assembly protein Flp/PilA
MQKSIMKFIKDEDGLTMVEYAVAGGMIAAAGVVAFQALGLEVDRIIDVIVGELNNVAPAGP